MDFFCVFAADWLCLCYTDWQLNDPQRDGPSLIYLLRRGDFCSFHCLHVAFMLWAEPSGALLLVVSECCVRQLCGICYVLAERVRMRLTEHGKSYSISLFSKGVVLFLVSLMLLT